MAAVLHQLYAAVVDGRVVGGTIDILQTAAVNGRANRFTGRFDMLLRTGIDLGIRRSARKLLHAAKQMRVGRGAAHGDVLQTAAVDRRAVRFAATVNELDAFIVDGGGFCSTVDALQTACVNERAGGIRAHLHMLHAAVADNGIARRTRQLLGAAKQDGA